ncbi:MAG: hypothetical protein V1908_02280 [Candidatus Peregrinibacteria bacterium]
MNSHTTPSPEHAPKKPATAESVESFIARKKAEQGHEGARAVQQSAEGVQHEVAEVMAGVEKPKEDLSEKGEKKGEQKAGGGSQAQTAIVDLEGQEDWRSVIFPDEEVMIKKIRTAIELQIKIEIKKAKRLQKNLITGGAQEYSVAISRIRRLKILLASLWTITVDCMKTIYMKYFRPDGGRRNTEDVSVD